MDIESKLTSDIELVQQIQTGSIDGFKVLYCRHYPFIRYYCRKAIEDEHTAEDLAQETFLRALDKINYFDVNHKRASFKAWIVTIAFTIVVNYKRRLPQEQKAVSMAFEKKNIGSRRFGDPRKILQEKEQKDILIDAISKLPELMRICVAAHYLIGLPYADMCTSFGLTWNQVTHRLNIGRRMLSKELRGLV